MKILFTNNTLETPAGSELVVVELAEALRARGHQVAAYSTHLGEIGQRLRGQSIPVLRDPRTSPFVPEVIHGQHHLDAMAALCAFPGVPALYHCHGYVPWVERPPLHPRIRRYVGMCELISERIRLELALADEDVVTVPNWFDANRFQVVRQRASPPLRALLFQRGFDRRGWHAGQLQRGFEQAGIALDLEPPSGDRRSPEVLLPDYDIVLASGRSAIEAMASGCAVMPLSATSCLDFVTPDNFDRMRAQNFSPRLQTGQLSSGTISERLLRFDADAATAVTAIVRSQCTLEAAVSQLEVLYHVTIESQGLPLIQHAPETCSKFAEELTALSCYLQMIKPMVHEVEQLSATCTSSEALILSLRSVLDSQTFLSEQNESMVAELEAIRLECDAMRQSSSWRVTQPLRWLMDGLARRRRGLSVDLPAK